MGAKLRNIKQCLHSPEMNFAAMISASFTRERGHSLVCIMEKGFSAWGEPCRNAEQKTVYGFGCSEAAGYNCCLFDAEVPGVLHWIQHQTGSKQESNRNVKFLLIFFIFSHIIKT